MSEDKKYSELDHCIKIYKNQIFIFLEDEVNKLINAAVKSARLEDERTHSINEYKDEHPDKCDDRRYELKLDTSQKRAKFYDKTLAKIKFNEIKKLISQIDIDINELKAAQKELEKEANRLNSEYKIKKKTHEWPTQYLEERYKKDENYRIFINSHKHLYSIRNDLFYNHYVKYRDSGKYNKRFGYYGEGKEKKFFVFVKPDIDKICKKFDIKKIDTVRSYIKLFCDLGILKEVGKIERGGQKIYAIGYWNIFKGEPKGRIPLLCARNFCSKNQFY